MSSSDVGISNQYITNVISQMYMYTYIYLYVSIMYMLYSTEQWEQQWCGYQALARAIAHLKPHPTPASEDDRLGDDDDDEDILDDEGGDAGHEGIHDDGDGNFIQVMILIPLLCYIRVAYTDLHWDGPESDTGASVIWKQKKKHSYF